MEERWDRRERGETPETFKAFKDRLYEQRLEIDHLKRKVRAQEALIDDLTFGQKV